MDGGTACCLMVAITTVNTMVDHDRPQLDADADHHDVGGFMLPSTGDSWVDSVAHLEAAGRAV